MTVPSGAQKILGALQLLGEKLVTYPLHRVEVELKALHRNPCKSLQALVECLLALLGQHKYVHLIFNQLPLQRLVDLILTCNVRNCPGFIDHCVNFVAEHPFH